MEQINNLLTREPEVKVFYEPRAGSADFSVKIAGSKRHEYALVFSDGEKTYTAGIVRGGAEAVITVAAEKILFADKAELIEIEEETAVFSGKFTPDGKTREKESQDANGKNEISAPAEDREEPSVQVLITAPEKTAEENETPDKLQTAENDSSRPETRGDLPKKTPLDSRKQVGFSEVFEPYEGISNAAENERYYIFDEYAAKKSGIKVRFAASFVPPAQLFLEYKNPFYSGELPHKLIGEALEDGKVKYFIFAVCGRKTSREQPFMGATGFLYHTASEENGLGYWKMYVNAATGKICVPSQKKL